MYVYVITHIVKALKYRKIYFFVFMYIANAEVSALQSKMQNNFILPIPLIVTPILSSNCLLFEIKEYCDNIYIYT